MIKIYHNNKIYHIKKSKLIFILTKLKNRQISELEVETILEKFKLLNDEFLENAEKL